MKVSDPVKILRTVTSVLSMLTFLISPFGKADASDRSARIVRVFILAGQSNMQGQGFVDLDHPKYYNGGRGTLIWSMKHGRSREQMKHLQTPDQQWTTRDDVVVRYQTEQGLKRGPLTIGFTGYGGSHHIGPELQFGHVLGDYSKDPVLLIKTCWGGKSLHRDFRPPSSGGETGKYYGLMLEEIETALSHMQEDFPHLQGHHPEISGFVWLQGWNDMIDQQARAEYDRNLQNLANDLRSTLKSPRLPIVVGELGNGGEAKPDSSMQQFRDQQRKGTKAISAARFVPTAQFARPAELSPNTGHGHHWFGNAESYFLIGDALGKAMVSLLTLEQDQPTPR